MKKGEGNSRNVWLLGGSSFFNDVGSEMIMPILPFYILALGGGGIALGLVSGLREGLSSLFKIFGGYVSDRTGKRKVFVFFGYLFSVVFRFFLGLVNSWQYLVTFISLERFGKFRDSPRDAMISEEKKTSGKNFGILQMMDTLGAILGIILVFIFFWKFNFSFKTIIFLAAGISVFSLLFLIFVKDSKVKKSKKSLLKGISGLNKNLKYFIFVSSVFSFANFGLYMFLLLVAKEFTGSYVYSILFYLIFNVVYASMLVPFGKLSDWVGRKKILVLGYLSFFGVSLGFIYFQTFFHLVVLFILYGFVYAIKYPCQKALVSDLSGEMKGTAFGLFNMSIGLAGIPGGIIAGILWNASHDLMFGYLSVISVAALFLLIFVRE
ncbi:MAG: MFS transporter [Candidatus Pacearchaeota archaeon]|jgi:MFS family permease